jgi:hypothetical protein
MLAQELPDDGTFGQSAAGAEDGHGSCAAGTAQERAGAYA